MKTFARIVLAIFLIGLISMLFACGARYELKRAKKLIAKAEAGGAKVVHDTVYRERKIIGPMVIVPQLSRDTIIYQDKIRIQRYTVHDTIHHTTRVMEKIKCPDVVDKEAIADNITITCPPENIWKWMLIGAGCMAVILLGIGWLVKRV